MRTMMEMMQDPSTRAFYLWPLPSPHNTPFTYLPPLSHAHAHRTRLT
jgi:hypothetical protein